MKNESKIEKVNILPPKKNNEDDNNILIDAQVNRIDVY